MENTDKYISKIGLLMAVSLVISSMIGTGIFTSLGYQLVDIHTPFSILVLWGLGGIIAFCGAVVYAELGAALPRSGGEYNILSKLYHPAIGFLAGWVSATVGFAAPAAIAALALAAYMDSALEIMDQKHFAAFIILIFNVMHAFNLKAGVKFQNAATLFKILVMLSIIFAGFMLDKPQNISILPKSMAINEIFSMPFAIAMVYVFYTYTGWNSSIYIVGDLDQPNSNLPKSLFIGTLAVAIIYILINYSFILIAPTTALAGQIEIGFIAGDYLFGENGATIVALLISLLLLSTVSAYVFVGPRVMQIIGEDFKPLGWLAKKNMAGIPQNAFVFSCCLSLVFIYTSTLDQVLIYTSFLLSLFTSLAVGSIFILRQKLNSAHSGYKAWGYPLTPIIFLLVNFWVMFFVIRERPYESLAGLLIVSIGIFIFYASASKATK